MAVYTEVTQAELEPFVARFDIGTVVSCDAIADGIENSNYRLTTTAGRFILTLFEARVAAGDLPYFIGLMDHLAGAGIPCPTPVRDRSGQALHRLAGKPAAIVTFLEGASPQEPTEMQCRALGEAAARLHLAGASFPGVRRNDLSVDAWRPIFEPLGARADDLRPGFSAWIGEELAELERRWPRDLPSGVIHADLFPDNVFFRDDRLSGIIDFYFAGSEILAYDLAVCLNAWCFDGDGRFSPPRAEALFAGYGTVRPLTRAEALAMPVLARGAALRFLLTRLQDWFRPRADPDARRKDPLALVPIAEFHRHVSDSALYGIDCPP